MRVQLSTNFGTSYVVYATQDVRVESAGKLRLRKGWKRARLEDHFIRTRIMTAQQLSIAFFLQMFFILAVCRVVGFLARKLGQPQVVGEMVAGVMMGPSLLGLCCPAFQQTIFPRESLKVLYVGAQLGVGLYMFLVGAEFKTELFRSRIRSAAAVSISGMLVPFALGAGLAAIFVKVPGLFSEKATLTEAILFLG